METATVHIHDGLGPRIGTLARVTSVNRSWAILQPGQASVRVPIIDDEGRIDPMVRDNVDPYLGRAIVIESDHYPFPWVGAITNAQDEPDTRSVALSAVSLDAIMIHRFLAADAAYDNDAGQVFKLIMQDMNLANESGIGIAGTPVQGRNYSGSFPDRAVYAALRALCEQTGNEFGMVYDVSPAGVQADAYFVADVGLDRFADVTLTDGGNCERVQSGVDGRGMTYTLHMVAGQTSAIEAYTDRSRVTRQRTAGQQPRDGAITGASASVHGYEVRRSETGGAPLTRAERLVIAENLRSEGAVNQASELLMGKAQPPERPLRLRVFEDDELWAKLDIGSVVRFVSEEAFHGNGYDGPVRIVSVHPFEEGGDMELVCQVLEGK